MGKQLRLIESDIFWDYGVGTSQELKEARSRHPSSGLSSAAGPPGHSDDPEESKVPARRTSSAKQRRARRARTTFYPIIPPANGDWVLDEKTREIGRIGLATAREILRHTG